MSKHFPKLAGIAGLILLKQYYNGSTCDIRRDLSGQVAIITGGNSGIGRETALGLAKQNCTVLITGRDNAKCEEAVKYIRENSGNSDVEYR
jgi:retinol dehydrogenase-12